MVDSHHKVRIGHMNSMLTPQNKRALGTHILRKRERSVSRPAMNSKRGTHWRQHVHSKKTPICTQIAYSVAIQTRLAQSPVLRGENSIHNLMHSGGRGSTHTTLPKKKWRCPRQEENEEGEGCQKSSHTNSATCQK